MSIYANKLVRQVCGDPTDQNPVNIHMKQRDIILQRQDIQENKKKTEQMKVKRHGKERDGDNPNKYTNQNKIKGEPAHLGLFTCVM